MIDLERRGKKCPIKKMLSARIPSADGAGHSVVLGAAGAGERTCEFKPRSLAKKMPSGISPRGSGCSKASVLLKILGFGLTWLVYGFIA